MTSRRDTSTARPEVRPRDLIGLVELNGLALVHDDGAADQLATAARRLVSAQRNGRRLPVRDVETVLRALGELDRVGDRAREHAYWIMAAAQETDWRTDPDHASFAQLARWFGMGRASQAQHALRRWQSRRSG